MIETPTVTIIKIIWNFLIALISGLLAYLGLDAEAIAVLTVLLGLDYVTGLIKAKRNKRIYYFKQDEIRNCIKDDHNCYPNIYCTWCKRC